MSLQKKKGFNEERVLSVCTGPSTQMWKKNVEDKNKNNVEDQILKKNKQIPSVSYET